MNVGGAHLLFVVLMAAAPLSGGQKQAEAFADGKAYKPKNADIKNGIKPDALANVPGQDAAATSDLTGLYGSKLINQGKDKVAACAAFVPGSDAYKNQDCETVNYVAGNASRRPQYVIDKTADPIIVNGNSISNAPAAYAAGTSGLTGTYSACISKTTNQPAQYASERCQVGRPVAEGQCAGTLHISYTWQNFAGQPGADLRYGRCGPGEVRGDQLTIPLTNGYRTQQAQCSARGWGQGSYLRTFYQDCTGAEREHGYDATGCSLPPAAPVNNPPRQVTTACTNAPRTRENCFTTTGIFTMPAQVPVFVDTWDYGTCPALPPLDPTVQR